MFNFRRFRLALPLVAFAALTACDDDTITPEEPGTIAAIASESGDLSTLTSALQSANLASTLEGPGPFTVFAPRDAAFTALGSDVVAGLLEEGNIDLLSRVLTFHVVAGAAVSSDELADGDRFETVEGSEIEVGVSGGSVTVNGIDVVSADVEASNGIVHIIDGVLTPETDIYETAVLTESTTTLASAVLAAELNDDLMGEGPFTVFAPDNAAFAALDAYTLDALLDAGNIGILQRVLGFHVIAGEEVLAADLTDGGTATTLEGGALTFDLTDAADPKVNGVSITATDIQVSNGVIHLVDEVILPEFNVVETATITEGFSTLVAAVDAAGLGAALSDEAASLTVFAPTNAAFEALGGSVDLLLEEDNQAILSDVLQYHVLGSEVASSGVSDGLTATTLEGGDVTFTADAGATNGFRINGADITVVDIETSNGVIHVIDAVLTQGLDAVQRAIVTPETQTLTAAVVAASSNGSEDLLTTLSGTGPFTVFAPVEAAFEALGTDRLDVVLDPANAELLSDILRYHVIAGSAVMAADLTDGGTATTYDGAELTFDLSGETPMVNGANIIATDIEVSNGVIHLIDGVLTETLDIPQVATVEGFSTLVAAVTEAGLAGDLSSPNGPYTVFAPTNEAFDALSALPTGQDLIDVLTYHVLDTEVASTDLSDGLEVMNTLNGASFTVNIDAGTGDVTITDQAGNTVNVIATDVSAENGIIHVIDGVIIPTP